MPRSTIKFYKEDRGYGFINCQGKKDLFFHIRDCAKNWIPEARESCEFEIGTNKKGPAAINVRPLSLPSSISSKADPNPNSASSSQASSLPAPYHFADIDLSLAIADTPVWHDGHGANRRHTGKLRISLKALTPLLVGSAQYKLSEAAPEIRRCQIGVIAESSRKSTLSEIQYISLSSDDVKATKTLLEPLRLEDRRVALAGQSLNGMLRHSLGALLSAPMERVAERKFTYRPNLGFAQEDKVRLEVRPAVIEKIAGEGDKAKVKVKVLPRPRAAVFLHEDAPRIIGSLGKPYGKLINKEVRGLAYRRSKSGALDRQRIESTSTRTTLPLNHYYFIYVGGLDGTGELARKFAEQMGRDPAFIHGEALVMADDYDKSDEVDVPDSVYQHYRKTQETLIRNMPSHSLSENIEMAKAIANDIESAAEIREKQLIYVEVMFDSDPRKVPTIVSMGHNFHYRWRYVDSVRQHASEVRQILRPIDGEQTLLTPDASGELPEHKPPGQLSGARLFYGYVSRWEESETWYKEGSDNIGKGYYQRLKGRIGCGFAIECGPDWPKGEIPDDHQRFLGGRDNDQFLIPLKPLGMPRPSAVEHYLRQPDANTLCVKRHGDGAALLTYGDLPEVPGMDADEPAELAGRKFYRHQPAAKDDPSCYEDEEHIASDQASLGRYLSKPGSVFRFTLDFQDLRGWELGALLVAAFPDHYLPKLVNRLAEKEPDAAFSVLQNKLAKLNDLAKQNDQPTLAHKLGHGRPLGLGSVLLILDKMEILAADEEGMPTLSDVSFLQPNTDAGSPPAVTRRDGVDLADCIEAFADKLLCPIDFSGNEPTTCVSAIEPGRLARHLERWAAVHRYAGLSKAAYPSSRDGKTYVYHTKIRWAHMKGRRQGAEDALRSPSALAESNLNDLLDS